MTLTMREVNQNKMTPSRQEKNVTRRINELPKIQSIFWIALQSGEDSGFKEKISNEPKNLRKACR